MGTKAKVQDCENCCDLFLRAVHREPCALNRFLWSVHAENR